MFIIKRFFTISLTLIALLGFAACASTDDVGGNCTFITLDPVTFNLNGTWSVTETTISSDDAECFDTKTYTLQITVVGNEITAFSPDLNATFTGEISGNQIRWSGSFPDGDGTSTVLCVELTASSDSSVSGTSSFEFVEPGFECSGSSQITAIKTS